MRGEGTERWVNQRPGPNSAGSVLTVAAYRPRGRSNQNSASERGADLQSRRMLQYVRTHSADLVPCFVAFETNGRTYAALAMMAMSHNVTGVFAKECRWVTLFLKYVQAQ